MVDQGREVRGRRTGILKDMREASFLRQLNPPDLRQTRTPQVEIDVQDLAPRLGVGNRQ